ncbi:hypothetical protein ACGF5F_29700 [Streptomyces sp. NPDC047821]
MADTECVDAGGVVRQEHDFWDEGDGYECRRCRAQLEVFDG